MHADANLQLAFESADSATTAELMSPAVADAVKSRTNFKLLALQFFIGGLVGNLGAKFVLGGIDDFSWASVIWVLAAVVVILAVHFAASFAARGRPCSGRICGPFQGDCLRRWPAQRAAAISGHRGQRQCETAASPCARIAVTPVPGFRELRLPRRALRSSQ